MPPKPIPRMPKTLFTRLKGSGDDAECIRPQEAGRRAADGDIRRRCRGEESFPGSGEARGRAAVEGLKIVPGIRCGGAETEGEEAGAAVERERIQGGER